MPVAALALAGVAGAVATSAIFEIGIASAIGIVGTGMSVVGQITGNQNMMKVGGFMGLAGGIANLAGIGQGVIGATESVIANTTEMQSLWSDVESAQNAVESANLAEQIGQGTTAESFSNVGDALTSSVPQPFTTPSNTIEQSYGGRTDLGASSSPSINGATQVAQPQGLLDSMPPIQQQKIPEITGEPGIDYGGRAVSGSPGINETIAPTTQLSSPGSPGLIGGFKDWWSNLPQSTKDIYIKAGLQGGSELFKGWSQQQQQDFNNELASQRQANLNAQPIIQRYQSKGLLSQG